MVIKFIHTPKRIFSDGSPVHYQIMIPAAGIWALADMACRLGHNAEIIHTGVEELLDPRFNLARDIADSSADLVCFSLHWHHQLFEVLEATKNIARAAPYARILLGGLTATCFAEEIMRDWPHIDFVIRGEGEKPLKRLLSYDLNNLSGIPGLSWRDGETVVHNPPGRAGAPAKIDEYSHTRLELLRNHDRWLGDYYIDTGDPSGRNRNPADRTWYLDAGRGCSVNCAYCGGGRAAHRALSGRRTVSARSPQSLFRDMAALNKDHGVRSFYLCFDPPGMKKNHYPELFSLVSAKMRVSMFFEHYSGTPDAAFLESFAAAFTRGVKTQLAFSPTAFTEEARKEFCPSAPSDEAIENFLPKTQKLGIRTTLYYSPLPQEPRDEILRGAERARALACRFENLTVVIMPIEIEPFSPWALAPERFGIKATRTSLKQYTLHHARRRGLETARDLGYAFPGYAKLMRDIGAICEAPRMVCLYPTISPFLNK